MENESGEVKVDNGEETREQLLARKHPYLGDPERRIIYIPAVPSSGTSLVAGILANLGVDMGASDPSADVRSRGYYMFEDSDMSLFGSLYDEDSDWNKKEIVLERHIRFRDYVNYRFIKNTSTRVGFKAPSTFWTVDPDPPSLPIDVVDVRRPLENSIMGDHMNLLTRKQRRPELDDPHIHHLILRAGSLGACWMARHILVDVHPPKITVDFDDLIDNPAEWITRIAIALDLNPSEDQVQTSIGFVNPKMRHV